MVPTMSFWESAVKNRFGVEIDDSEEIRGMRNGKGNFCGIRKMRAMRRILPCLPARMRPYICIVVLLALILCAFIVTALDDGDELIIGSANEVHEEPASFKVSHDKLHLAIVGDTGGIPIMHTTPVQKRVAKALANYAAHSGLDAIINVGDNIYFTGAENEFDSRFESSFEVPYMSEWLRVPWYMIAGNHDHYGNVSAQIAYSKYSRRWNFPAQYYNLTFKTPDGSEMDLIMIDTIVLCGNSRDIQNSNFFGMLFSWSHDPQGPVNETAAEIEWQWIEERLKNSKAPYLFVAGHYPVYSVSSHGPIKCLVDRLLPLLYKYNVSAYMAGHDHTLQHIKTKKDGKTMEFIISGAASRADPSKKHLQKVVDAGTVAFRYPKSGTIFKQLGMGDGGFAVMEVSKEEASLRFADDKGEYLYATSIKPREVA